MAKFGTYILAAGLAAGAWLLGGEDACAQSRSATVRASVTILRAVNVRAPTSFRSNGRDGDLSLDGTAQVTSPAPHILTAQVEAWGRETSFRDFARVHPGRPGALPEEVRVTAAAGSNGRVHVTYTVAVIL